MKVIEVLKEISTATSLVTVAAYSNRMETILERVESAMKIIENYLNENEKDVQEIRELYNIIQHYANEAKKYVNKNDLLSEARYKECIDLSRNICKKIAEKLWEIRSRYRIRGDR